MGSFDLGYIQNIWVVSSNSYHIIVVPTQDDSKNNFRYLVSTYFTQTVSAKYLVHTFLAFTTKYLSK